jgi:hypothetical protein
MPLINFQKNRKNLKESHVRIMQAWEKEVKEQFSVFSQYVFLDSLNIIAEPIFDQQNTTKGFVAKEESTDKNKHRRYHIEIVYDRIKNEFFFKVVCGSEFLEANLMDIDRIEFLLKNYIFIFETF